MTLQALAGARLPHHLHDWQARHAAAEGRLLALATQLPARTRFICRRTLYRPSWTQGSLPQESHTGLSSHLAV